VPVQMRHRTVLKMKATPWGNHRPAPSHVVVAITRAPPDLPSHGAKDEGTAVDVGGKEELEVLTLRLLWW
jgi:hypothetical protein